VLLVGGDTAKRLFDRVGTSDLLRCEKVTTPCPRHLNATTAHPNSPICPKITRIDKQSSQVVYPFYSSFQLCGYVSLAAAMHCVHSLFVLCSLGPAGYESFLAFFDFRHIRFDFHHSCTSILLSRSLWPSLFFADKAYVTRCRLQAVL